MVSAMLREWHLCHPDRIADLVATHAVPAGFGEPLIYLIDVQQERLVLLPPRAPAPSGGDSPPEWLPVDSTDGAGRVFRRSETSVTAVPGGHHVWLPLLDGVERLGALRVTVAEADESTLAEASDLASLVALLVLSERPYSDTYARLGRRREMSLAAEVQWALMPPLSLATDQVQITGLVEPAYEANGDLFDYALEDDLLHLALFGSVGKGLSSAVISGLTWGAYRHARRSGCDLEATSAAIERAVFEQFAATRAVSAFLGRLHIRTGELESLLLGHPPPILLRGGERFDALGGVATLPLGTGLRRRTPTVTALRLEPDDRIFLYNRGLTDARDPEGEAFGLWRATTILLTRLAEGLPDPEAVRQLVHAVTAHQGGQLQQDNSVLLLHWCPSGNRPADTG